MPQRHVVPPALRIFKAARVLLGWSSQEFALMAGLTRTIVMDFEAGRGCMSQQRMAHIKGIYVAAGITFLRDGLVYRGMTEEDKDA